MSGRTDRRSPRMSDRTDRWDPRMSDAHACTRTGRPPAGRATRIRPRLEGALR